MNLLGFNISREVAGMQGGITARGVDVDAAMSALRETPAKGDAQPKKTNSADFVEKSVTITGPRSALTVSAWYAGLSIKAETFAQLVLEYQRQNDKSHGMNYEMFTYGEAKNINYLLQVQPNPTMTTPQFLAQAAIMREVYGNAVIYVERDREQEIKAFWLCTNARVDVERMECDIQYKRPGVGIVGDIVDLDDVIVWPNSYSEDGGITGVSTLRFAGKTLSISATNDKQALDSAAKGGRYKILIKEEQQPDFGVNLYTNDQIGGARNSLQEQLNEGGDVVSVNGLLDAKVISQSNNDLSLLDMRKFDTQAVARYLRVPLVLLMDYTNNTYKAPEQAMQAFLQYTIAPMAASLEAELNRKLIGRKAYPTLRFHFNDKNLTRLDPKGRMEIAKGMLECGIMCVNELRSEYGLPAIKDGDRHLVSTNLQPLDDIKVGVQTQPTNANANDNKDKEDE